MVVTSVTLERNRSRPAFSFKMILLEVSTSLAFPKLRLSASSFQSHNVIIRSTLAEKAAK